MALATKRKPPAHYKKRQAGHHRHNKQYVKSYWPYLPMVLLVAGGLLLSNLWNAKSHVLGVQSDFSVQTLLDGTNAQRSSDQEAGLSLSSQLNGAAQAKANDMMSKNYWAHTSPSGQTPWDFISASGYSYSAAGENLAYGFGNANQVINGWMHSSEHRANILDAKYTNVGFGVVSSPDFLGKGPAVIVVAEYGEPSGAAANISFTVPPQTGAVDGTKATEPGSQAVSRWALVSNRQPSWSTLAISVLAASALTLFVIRHALRLRRVLVKGEVFIAHHPGLDLAFVFIFMAGYVLTRASGVIR